MGLTKQKTLLCISAHLLLGGASESANASLPRYVFERSIQISRGCGPFRWTIDEERKKIRFQVTSTPSAEWVGIGLSENGGMKGADITIVREKHGVFDVMDMISTDYVRPSMDVLQSVELLTADRTEDDRIIAVLERDLQSCDFDDLPVHPYKQDIICASGGLDQDGSIAYHGNQRDSVQVNLMVDEELLFDRKYNAISNVRQSIELSPGVIMNGDLSTSSTPVAIDITMPGIEIDPTRNTTYMCRVINITDTYQISAFESVWGGGKTSKDEPQPEFVHHTDLYHCNPDRLDPAILNGQPYDCFNDMPECDTIFNLGRTPLLVAPAGVSLGMKAGTLILLAHYENRNHIPIENDKSGMRFWALPESQAKLTTSGQVINAVSTVDTIRIPADPLRRDYELQFMISSAATKAVLPEGGIQVFGTTVHMHKAGVRAHLQLIRNGENIKDLYDTRGYDFYRQAVWFNRWILLPGDALILTCTYRPRATEDIVGGLRTDQEMCDFGIGFVPEIPGIGSIIGYSVERGEPFRNSFIGKIPNGTSKMTLPYEEAIYPPDLNSYKDLRHYRDNVCEKMFRDRVKAPEFEYSHSSVYALYTIFAAFFLCVTMEKFVPCFMNISKDRTRRNAVVCTLQLLFSTIFLIPLFVSMAPVLPSHTTFQAYNPKTYIFLIGLIWTQVLLYMTELFYRIDPRIEVVVHHVLTGALLIFLAYVATYTFAYEYALKLGAVLTLLAMLDQPKNLALLLRYCGYAETSWWPSLCKCAAIWYVVSKLAITAFALVVMDNAMNDKDASWQISKHSFVRFQHDYILTPASVVVVVTILLTGLLIDQLYTGRVLWLLATRKSQYSVIPMKMQEDGIYNENKFILTGTNGVSSEDSSDTSTDSMTSHSSIHST